MGNSLDIFSLFPPQGRACHFLDTHLRSLASTLATVSPSISPTLGAPTVYTHDNCGWVWPPAPLSRPGPSCVPATWQPRGSH